MPEDGASTTAAWLAEEWARQLTRVLEMMTGEGPYITYTPHELTEAETQTGEEPFLWWEQPVSLGEDARIWIGASPPSWQEIGNRVLRSAGVEELDAESVRSTYLEVLSQALSGLAGAMSSRVHREVTCQDGHAGPPEIAAIRTVYTFEVTIGEMAFSILAAYSDAVLALSAEQAEQPAPQAPPAHQPGASAAAPPPNSIELLLDVELPVSVSFGRAQLPLKDVIKLTTGSIVELNRSISEPVEVIVNNCVIARGEVVVVEGNFGIRIKQVISRQERLRTLN